MKSILPLFALLLAVLASPAATITWNNPSGGSWQTAANWQPAQVPGAADTALITLAGTYTVTLANNVTVSQLTLGAASGTQTLTLAGQTLDATGSGTVAANGALTIQSGALKGSFTIASGGILTFASGAQKALYQLNLVNHGTVRWLGGNLGLGSTPTSIFTNTGLWEISADDTLYQGIGGPAPQFVNTGTLRKVAGAGTTSISSIRFDNSGLVEAQTGTIQFNSMDGLILGGTFTAAGGATVQLGSGTFTENGAVFNGTGNRRMNGGTLTLVTDKIEGLSLNGGDIKIGPAFQAAGAISDLAVNGSTLVGTNQVAGVLTFTAGGAEGKLTVLPAGRVVFAGGGAKTLYRLDFINQGTVQWSGGNLTLGATPTTALSNAGLWEISGDASMSQGIGGPTPQFVNTGTLRKLGGAGATSISSIHFENLGTVEIASGTLQFNSAEATRLGGTFAAASSGAVLNFASGTFVENGAVFGGAGHARLSGGTLTLVRDRMSGLALTGGDIKIEPTFQASGSITNLIIAGSTLVGTNIVTGSLTLQAGGIEGKLTVAPGGTLLFSGSGQKTAYRARLINQGTVRWLGGNIGLGATPTSFIANEGLWEIAGDDTLYQTIGGPDPEFANSGTLRKISGSGTTLFSSLVFINTGLVQAQSGTIQFSSMSDAVLGGTFTSETGAVIQFAGGTFIENGGVFNGEGIRRMSGGTLALVNNILSGLSLAGGDVRIEPTFQDGGAISNLTLSGSTLVGTNEVSGTLTVLAGGAEGKLTVRPGGTLAFTGAAQKTLYRLLLLNHGTMRWLGGNLALGATPATSITNTGLWEIGGSETIYQAIGGPDPSVVNTGTIRKIAGGGTSQFSSHRFANTGTVEVQIGMIQFSSMNGSSIGGQFATEPGAVIQWAGGTFAENGGVFTGGGVSRMTGGTLSLVADILHGLSLNGGDVKVGPAFQAAGAITNLTLNGATLIETNQVAGTLLLTDGGIEGRITVLPAGQIVLSGTTQKTLYKLVLQNNGKVRWLGGNLSLGSTPTSFLHNAGLWEIESDATLFQGIGGATPQFHNSGTLRKLGGAGSTTVGSTHFNNSGLVEILNGTIQFSSAESNVLGGTFTAAAGAALQLASGTYVENGGVFTGEGTLRMTGGTLSLITDQMPGLSLAGGDVKLGAGFQAAGAITSLVLNGATLVGTNEIAGILTASDGGFEGRLTVRPEGQIVFSGASQKTLYKLVLHNHGTVRWLGGNLSLGSTPTTVINNNGLWEAASDNTLFQGIGGPDPQFVNAGTLRKTAGTGVTTLSGIVFNSAGLVEVQTGTLRFPNNYTHHAGTLRLAGGRIECGGLLTVASGALEGTGSFGNSEFTGGLLSPGVNGPGQIVFNSGLKLGSAVRLRIDATGETPGTGHDQLVVIGLADLGNATLEVPSIGPVPVGASLVFLQNDGVEVAGSVFTNFPEGWLFQVGTQLFRLRYRAGTGNDVALIRDDGGVRLTAIRMNPDGSFLLRGLGTNFGNYAISATSDYANWTDLGNTTANNGGVFEFTDPQAGAFPLRVYRSLGPGVAPTLP